MCVCVCNHACIYVDVFACMNMDVFVCVRVCVCTCVHTHVHSSIYLLPVLTQGLTLASDISHLTDKICKCPIDVSYKRTNVLLICYKGGHCPIISSFTRTSRSAFFFFFRAAEAASAINRLEDI